MANRGGENEDADILCPNNFLSECRQVVEPAYYNTNNGTLFDYLSQKMHMSEEMFKELSEVCGEETLTCDEETGDDLLSNIPEGLDLTCTSIQRQELKKRQKSTFYRRTIKNKMKYASQDAPGMHKVWKTILDSDKDKDKESEDNKNNVVIGADSILTVYFYKPFHYKYGVKSPKVDTIYQVLGCQKLTELKDVLSCINDLHVIGEFSQNPDFPSDTKASDIYKSSMFYFEKIFYNDTRHTDCRDYSSIIMDWAKGRPGVGPYKKCDMQDVTFGELQFKLGEPYLYLHQGNCEHLVIITDCRLKHPDDVEEANHYPLVVSHIRTRKNHCRVCSENIARWVTEGCTLAQEDPCFYCDTCFRLFHYDSKGKKMEGIGDFKAYPYVYEDT